MGQPKHPKGLTGNSVRQGILYLTNPGNPDTDPCGLSASYLTTALARRGGIRRTRALSFWRRRVAAIERRRVAAGHTVGRHDRGRRRHRGDVPLFSQFLHVRRGDMVLLMGLYGIIEGGQT